MRPTRIQIRSLFTDVADFAWLVLLASLCLSPSLAAQPPFEQGWTLDISDEIETNDSADGVPADAKTTQSLWPGQQQFTDPPASGQTPEGKPTGENPADELAELTNRLKKLEAQTKKWGDAEEQRNRDKKERQAQEEPTVQWTGQLQSDLYYFAQDADSRSSFGDISDGVAFRRARLGMLGEYGVTEYRIEMDFALSGRPTFLDVFVGVKDVPLLGRVRVGHFFEPFSLDRYTPNRFMTFMERSLPDQPFAPARNLGVMANRTFSEKRGTWAAGLFRTDSDVFGDDVGDTWDSAVTQRITWLPYHDDLSGGRRYAHLGLGYSFRDANNGVVQFRSQPEARLGSTSFDVPFFVDTGRVNADYYQLLGLEGASCFGPLLFQAEYYFVPVSPADGGIAQLHGWYATASYFLTGEHRPYNKNHGTFDRVIPHSEFTPAGGKSWCCHGWGAWELAARVSRLDLDDGAFAGGQLTDVTVGVNWYLNRYLRTTMNYVHAFADPAMGNQSTTGILGFRVGFDF